MSRLFLDHLVEDLQSFFPARLSGEDSPKKEKSLGILGPELQI